LTNNNVGPFPEAMFIVQHLQKTLARLKAFPGKNSRAILGTSMNRSLKTFLIWLLMAILPLHAVAAGVGMSCAPDSSQVSHKVERIDAAHPGAGIEMHAHHGAHASGAGDSGSDTHAQPAKFEKQAHSSCSACSALCAGAVAPPSALLAVPSFGGSDVFLVSPLAMVPGFIPDGPQRPPRRQSA
jgi:hypothetical protein